VNVSLLLGTLAIALYNASKDSIAKQFALVYAVISLLVFRFDSSICACQPHRLLTLRIPSYGFVTYQKRITMIRKRDPNHFGTEHLPHLLLSFEPDWLLSVKINKWGGWC
jgi:hypothetical protein